MNKFIKKEELREFGFLLAIGLPVIFGLLVPILLEHDFRLWTFLFTLPFLFFAIFLPHKLKRIYFLWISIGNILGWINSKIVFGIVFCLVLCPISFFMKMFGYDPLKKQKSKLTSYKLSRDIREFDLTRIF